GLALGFPQSPRSGWRRSKGGDAGSGRSQGRHGSRARLLCVVWLTDRLVWRTDRAVLALLRRRLFMTRIIGPPRSRRRRRTFFVFLALALGVGVFVIAGAQAVHDTGAFQLDGNAQTSDLGTPPSNGVDDWDRVCHQVQHSDCSTTSDTTGATAVSFTNDGAQNATIFTTGGSKDPQDLDQWQWKDQLGGLPDKDNLQDSFAARYSLAPSATCPVLAPATTCELLYFGSDRFDNSGDAQQGFWFFQKRVSLAT